jgi:hypothetical protein
VTLRGNRAALRSVRADVTLKLVWGAGHTFEESGAIGAVGRTVERWLTQQFPEPSASWPRRIATRWFPAFRELVER